MLKRGSCWPFLSPHPLLFAAGCVILFSLVSSCIVKDLYQQCLAKINKIAASQTGQHVILLFDSILHVSRKKQLDQREIMLVISRKPGDELAFFYTLFHFCGTLSFRYIFVAPLVSHLSTFLHNFLSNSSTPIYLLLAASLRSAHLSVRR